MRFLTASLSLAAVAAVTVPAARAQEIRAPGAPRWDTRPDSWAATDALGRELPLAERVGPPRRDRTVAMFYFLWLGEHVRGGPYDITRILQADPRAMQKPDSPLWGPLLAPHHWGEPLFGYYLTDDPYVLRKHAQLLSDAGVDTVVFDVTNQVTYKRWYMALLKTWSEIRAEGGRTPQVAFLAPFWQPATVVRELYRDLYQLGLYSDLWFRWESKPFILADPDLLEETEGTTKQSAAIPLAPGHSLGQTFTAGKRFDAVGGRFPTWGAVGAAVTLTLRADGPAGPVLASKRFRSVADNAWVSLRLPSPAPPGRYYLEASDPAGPVGWWSDPADTLPGGQAHADGGLVPGDRTLQMAVLSEEAEKIRSFFTFRKPQPDYFQGPTQPDMWSWLEVYPQHVFRNRAGQKEQMSVGVAQNAVNGRLATMSEAGAHGRTWRDGRRDTSPDAVRRGPNFAEQFERALKEDPRALFITGWNEWIAGRFAEFNGVKQPVMFVDEFNQEFSRDIEPMAAGPGSHGDDYYYQLVSYVRRYKGARAPERPSKPKSIEIDGRFEDWASVGPEFRDDIGDLSRRDHAGWNNVARYTNMTGRNDFVALKVARDPFNLYFYVRAKDPITPPAGDQWMNLFIRVEGGSPGWEGFNFVVNRAGPGIVEKCEGGWKWREVAKVSIKVRGHEMEMAIPREVLGLPPSDSGLRIDFKWADNAWADGKTPPGDPNGFLLNGDTAPNGRFRYVYRVD